MTAEVQRIESGTSWVRITADDGVVTDVPIKRCDDDRHKGASLVFSFPGWLPGFKPYRTPSASLITVVDVCTICVNPHGPLLADYLLDAVQRNPKRR